MRAVVLVLLVAAGALVPLGSSADDLGIARSFDELRAAYLTLCKRVEYIREAERPRSRSLGALAYCVCADRKGVAYVTTTYPSWLPEEVGHVRASVLSLAERCGGCTDDPDVMFTHPVTSVGVRRGYSRRRWSR